MTNLFRAILLIVTFFTCLYIMGKVRKAQIKIQDCVFWIYLPLILLIICFFPNLAFSASKILGIGATVNFIFLTIIFLLLLQLFILSMKVSKLQNKLEELVEEYSIDQKAISDNKKACNCKKNV